MEEVVIPELKLRIDGLVKKLLSVNDAYQLQEKDVEESSKKCMELDRI